MEERGYHADDRDVVIGSMPMGPVKVLSLTDRERGWTCDWYLNTEQVEKVRDQCDKLLGVKKILVTGEVS